MSLTFQSVEDRRWFEQTMETKYRLTKQRDELSYLGMTIRRNASSRNILISQEGMIAALLKKFNCEKLQKYPSLPANDELVTDKASPICDKKKFRSLVMSLLYIARFTRPDILFATSYLATRSENPTQDDASKLFRVLKYLGGTRSTKLVIKRQDKIQPVIYADASHGLHEDGKGHGGIVITLGSAPVYTKSYKLKMITRSSSEAELVVLEEASTFTGWYKNLLSDLGIDVGAIPIYQDNKSTIIMAAQGGNFQRTKHLMMKDLYIKERLECNDARLLYLPTEDMVADLLTKPLGRVTSQRHVSTLSLMT